ncbi:hypothetical protein L6452_00345 [Arctium lappa]|uniref:Uncharacterized protein n=1 Tax=Arctium lappa TaxID=4217 RepID=A0ACB9FD85_ARCLA|nr:hypothetical protein L6452_00345 [Arctium lappa]
MIVIIYIWMDVKGHLDSGTLFGFHLNFFILEIPLYPTAFFQDTLGIGLEKPNVWAFDTTQFDNILKRKCKQQKQKMMKLLRLMGKVASDKCHKWVFKEPSECEQASNRME